MQTWLNNRIIQDVLIGIPKVICFFQLVFCQLIAELNTNTETAHLLDHTRDSTFRTGKIRRDRIFQILKKFRQNLITVKIVRSVNLIQFTTELSSIIS